VSSPVPTLYANGSPVFHALSVYVPVGRLQLSLPFTLVGLANTPETPVTPDSVVTT
jgi:hypothetical protein